MKDKQRALLHLCSPLKDAVAMQKPRRVWCAVSEKKWILGVANAPADNMDDACVRIVDQEYMKEHGPQLKLPASKLLPANPVILEGVIDLIQLTYLNEPSVLYNLGCRYSQDKIYTRAGPVLIAINPFKKLPLYTKDCLASYGTKTEDKHEPHVYATMASAFEAMMRGLNQSVIISGESGAGKTETAKIAMQFLTAVGGGGGLEIKLLQTNPILEAFGNAKTSRNNNSSRFGKLIDIFFEDSGKVAGAWIQTYLLEKKMWQIVSRELCYNPMENGHIIFFTSCVPEQMIHSELSILDSIHLLPAKDYEYLNQTNCLHIENVDDAENFREVLHAMDDVQITKEEQQTVFEMLSAVLWLGNITFSIIDDETHVHVDDSQALEYASKLLKCSKDCLIRSLSSRTIRAGNEVIRQDLTYLKAIDSRDALAKALYAGLFDWFVDRINRSFEGPKCPTRKCISILDIYGFESFLKNSFEQLCINYANERLQQHFNRHLFKLEQEEYTSEGIDWTHVEFEDNQECLELVEKWPLGLLSLLDEECTFPKGTDDTFLEKLKLHLNSNTCFKSERIKAFTIRHYAGKVTYDTTGFLEKNKDVLHEDLLLLFASCKARVPQVIATKIRQGLPKTMTGARRTGVELQKQSIAIKFKGQLCDLMQRLDNTEPHFIRCIKPNTLQRPNLFQEDLVLHQLCCCGVLEVVRISRAGYPTRMSHQSFASRYGFLLAEDPALPKDALNSCLAILERFSIQPEMCQVGKTKIFLKAGQIGRLEDCREKTLEGIICFQKLYRGYKVRCRYKALRRAIIVLQSLIRARKARKEYQVRVNEHHAAIVLQRYTRGRQKQKLYVQKRQILLAEQGDESMTPSSTHGHDSSPDQNLMVTRSQKDARARASASLITKFESQIDSAEATIREKELENANLREKLEQYETLWAEFSGLEAMWRMQIRSIQRQINAAKQSIGNQGDSPPELSKLDNTSSFQSSLMSTPRGSRHILPYSNDIFPQNTMIRRSNSILQHNNAILPHDDMIQHKNSEIMDEFDWDETASSVDSASSENNSTLQKTSSQTLYLSPEKRAAVSDRSLVSELRQEFEHRQQVFMDDAEFVKEVKSAQTEAYLNPDEELSKLKERFIAWTKEFKDKLKNTKGVLQKLGDGEAAPKMKKKWWNKPKVLLHGL